MGRPSKDDDDFQMETAGDVWRRHWADPQKRKLIIVGGLASLLLIVAILFGPTHGKKSQKVDRENDAECDDQFPRHNAKKVFEPAWMKSRAAHTEWQVENRTGAPVWIKLLDPNYENPLIAVMVHPGQVAGVTIPVGQYKAEFRAGTWWCNFETELTDVPSYKVANEVQIASDSISRIRVARDESDNLEASIVKIPKGAGRMAQTTEKVALKEVRE